jgi:hypothetical protein
LLRLVEGQVELGAGFRGELAHRGIGCQTHSPDSLVDPARRSQEGPSRNEVPMPRFRNSGLTANAASPMSLQVC